MSIINKITGLFGIACFTILGFEAIQVMKQNKSTITIYGLADKIVISDKAKMYLIISENGNDMEKLNEKLKKDKEVIYDFLKKQGIDEKEIQEDSVELQDNYYQYYYSNKEGKIPEIRYKITKTFVVNTKKVDTIRVLKSKITSLLENNIFVTTTVKYSYSKFDDLKLKLIEEATKDAMERAEHLSKVIGSNLKRVRNLSTGKFNILNGENNTPDDTNWSYGEDSYKKRYRIIVNVTYDKD